MAALSLFSGCGGDTLGMNNAGLDVKWYSEIKKPFCKTHESNFPNSECIGTDITKIPDEKFKELKGKVKVIFAGFPCQSFSHAGKKRADDMRGQLYLDFVRATKNIEPEFIIGENVKGLLSRKTSTGEIPLSSTRKHLVIKTVNKNNLYQYLYPNIKSYYLMFKIKI